MTVTVQDAAQRRVVRWGDRTARLVSVPGRVGRKRHGAKAVVVLASGAHLSVDPEQLEVID